LTILCAIAFLLFFREDKAAPAPAELSEGAA